MGKSIIQEQAFDFALNAIEWYQFLINNKKEYVMSKQLLRSATSVGANVREAKNAQSNRDFIHKLYIAQKECDETLYWLELLIKSSYLENDEKLKKFYTQGESLLKMLKSAILTTKQKHNL